MAFCRIYASAQAETENHIHVCKKTRKIKHIIYVYTYRTTEPVGRSVAHCLVQTCILLSFYHMIKLWFCCFLLFLFRWFAADSKSCKQIFISDHLSFLFSFLLLSQVNKRPTKLNIEADGIHQIHAKYKAEGYNTFLLPKLIKIRPTRNERRDTLK